MLIAIGLVAGCGNSGGGKTTPPGCAGSQPPASCFADLAPPSRTDLAASAAAVDLARAATSSPDLMPLATGLVISGDAASGYAGTTVTSFVCTTSAGGAYVKIAPFADLFSSSNPVHGVTPLELDISSNAIDLIGGNGPNLYYSTRGGVSFPTTNKSGTINNLTLQPQPGIPGTLTLDGTWHCP